MQRAKTQKKAAEIFVPDTILKKARDIACLAVEYVSSQLLVRCGFRAGTLSRIFSSRI